MIDVQRENFQFAPGTVTYKGTNLGSSKGPVNIVKETSIHNVFCDSLAIEPKYSIVRGVRMEISMTLVEIDSSMDMFLDAGGQLDRTIIGSDIKSNAGELVVTTTENGKTITYKFPNAVLFPDYKCSIDDDDDNVIDVVFYGGSNSGTYMQKIIN